MLERAWECYRGPGRVREDRGLMRAREYWGEPGRVGEGYRG